MSELNGFQVADYCLFGAVLLASAVIGLFYAWRERRKHGGVRTDSVKDQLLGGAHMPVIPTALSLLTSFISGVTLLAIPADIYLRGILYWLWFVVGTTVALLVAIFIALPILYDLKPLSVYEYFQARFNSRFLRWAASILYLVFTICYMGVVLYAPSVALAGVAKTEAWIFFITTGLVCCFYTALGGLKAVVWTDTLQAGIMIVGVTALFAMGCHSNGGVTRTFEVAGDYERFAGLSNIDPNFFQYNTLWTAMFGGIGFWFNLLTFNQVSVQRYLSMGKLSKARICLFINIPSYIIMSTLATLIGIVMFTHYRGCDPVTVGIVSTPDQLVIHFALETFGRFPGLPGLFLAVLFSGTLSTVSSGMNSLACVTWDDFLSFTRIRHTTEKRKAIYIKLLSLFYGLLSIGIAFAAKPLGGILKAAISTMGAIGGPMVGLFLLGMLFPRANRIGAIVGLAVSVIFTFWVALGNALLKPYATYALPGLTGDQCTNSTQSWAGKNWHEYKKWTHDIKPEPAGLDYLYTLCPVFYPALGIILVLLFGLPVSYVTKADAPSEMRSHAKDHHVPRLTVQDIYRKKAKVQPSKQAEAQGRQVQSTTV